jgi:hypothetical protein
MEDRPIKGTVDWTQATVVMDVPPEAAAIGIGFFLSGTGQMWVNDVQFDVVGNDVPVTRPVPKSVPATGK